jgi:hypothetical protein
MDVNNSKYKGLSVPENAAPDLSGTVAFPPPRLLGSFGELIKKQRALTVNV